MREKQSTSTNLARLESGRDILDLLDKCDTVSFDNDDLSKESEVALISQFFQSIERLARVLLDFAPSTRINLEFDFTNAMKILEDAGFLVYGGIETRRIEDGVSNPAPFYVSIIKVMRNPLA